ncbi:MAG: hypothetical protein ACXWHI_11465 [Candidatus Aminicenantales bacterium]
MHKPKLFRRLALILPVLVLASAASAATVPAVKSGKLTTPIRLDGKADDWAGVPRVFDAKAGTEFAFQNDARNLYVLVVMKRPESLQAVEATGMTILGHPGRSRKQAKGVLFLNRQISADGYIAWRESQGAILTEADKAEIRKLPRHPISLAFAVDAKGSSYGPLRKQTDVFPPDSSMEPQELEAAYEFRIPLASPGLVPGGIGGTPGASIRISFEWGGTDRSNLSTQASRESPSSTSGYMSGTGRTWGQEYLDSYDSMSRPNLGNTKKFSFAVDVRLADAS